MKLRTAVSTLSGMAARASNQLATVIVTLFATRFLGPRDFGVFALASLATTLIRTLLYTGAFEFLLKTPTARDTSSECLAANFLLSLALSIVVALGVLGSGAIWGPSPLTAVMLALLPSNLISAVGAWRESLLLRTRRVSLYYTLNSAAVFTAAMVGVVLLFMGQKVWALVWQVYVRNILIVVFYFATGPIELSERFSRARLAEICNWSLSRYAATLVGFSSNYGVDAMLGILLSPTAVGLYRASNRLVTAISDVFAQPIRLIAMTTFSARAAAGRASDEVWPAMAAVVFATGGAVLVGVAAVSKLVVPIMLAKSWAQAATLLPILAISRTVGFFDSINSPLLVAYDHQRLAFRLQLFVTLAGLPVLFIASYYGLYAATMAVLVTSLLARILVVSIVVRLVPPRGIPLPTFVTTALAPPIATFAGAAVTVALIAPLHLGDKLAAVLAIAGGAAAWACVMLLLRQSMGQMMRVLQSTDLDLPAGSARRGRGRGVDGALTVPDAS